jgi:hypothetical protein
MLDSAGRGENHASHIRRIAACCGCAFMLFGAAMAHADYIIAANSTTSLNGGALNLSCTDLVVAGTLNLGSGAILNARNLTVQPGGVVQGGSGFIALSGNWTVSATGQFVAGTSDVHFDEGCGPGASVILGSTTFYDVHFKSTLGKNFVFGVNTTQTIVHLFEFTGTAAAPSQFRSSTPGQVANIDLRPGGTQVISHVGVTDVWATGQWLAPFSMNEGGGGNARRWFGVPDDGVPPAPIPALANTALVALAALLAAAAWLTLHMRRHTRRRTVGKRPWSRPL